MLRKLFASEQLWWKIIETCWIVPAVLQVSYHNWHLPLSCDDTDLHWLDWSRHADGQVADLHRLDLPAWQPWERLVWPAQCSPERRRSQENLWAANISVRRLKGRLGELREKQVVRRQVEYRTRLYKCQTCFLLYRLYRTLYYTAGCLLAPAFINLKFNFSHGWTGKKIIVSS